MIIKKYDRDLLLNRMEENKNCCESKECEKSENCCISKCCMWKKCPMLKNLLWVVIIILAFYLGAQLGELKSESRGYRHEGCGKMMDWDYKNVKPLTSEAPGTPTAPSPEVKQ